MPLRHTFLGVEALRKTFHPLGLTARQSRQNRTVHEACASADPLRLRCWLGINGGTVMRYIAAHPEKNLSPFADSRTEGSKPGPEMSRRLAG